MAEEHALLACSDGTRKSVTDVAPLRSAPWDLDAHEAARAGRQPAHNDASELEPGMLCLSLSLTRPHARLLSACI